MITPHTVTVLPWPILMHWHARELGPPIPNTGLNVTGINTDIALFSTVVFGISNSRSRQRDHCTIWPFVQLVSVGAAAVPRRPTSRHLCITLHARAVGMLDEVAVSPD